MPLEEIQYTVRLSYYVGLAGTGKLDTRFAWPDLAGFSSELTVHCLYPQDFPTIRFNARESVEMPFRASQRDSSITTFNIALSCTGYMIVPGTKDEPLLPPGMKAHLHADLDQSFDF